MPCLRHIQPPTRALFLACCTVQPHGGLQTAPLLGGLCWQLSDHQRAVPKPQELLRFPWPTHCPAADLSSRGVLPLDLFFGRIPSPLLPKKVTIWLPKWLIKSNFAAKPVQIRVRTCCVSVPRWDAYENNPGGGDAVNIAKKTLAQPDSAPIQGPLSLQEMGRALCCNIWISGKRCTSKHHPECLVLTGINI